MPKFENSRKERDNLLARRANHLKAAEDFREKGDNTNYQSELKKAKDLNPQIDDLNALIDEADRYTKDHAPKFGSDRKDREEMGRMLMARESVKIDVVDVLADFRRNEGTLVSGSIVTPQGGGSQIHDGFAGQVSSLINQVNTVNLYGLSSWEEPYVVSDMEAQGGDPAENSGKARTASDPAFAKAGMTAYEASITSYVDKKIAQLSPADYASRIQVMALRALHRKAVALMINGDGSANPKMYGILNAKNTDGDAIFAALADATKIDADTLNALVFGYGGDEMVGGNARLLLDKANLQAFGALRGTNEKQRLFKITRDAANPNTGTIEDGGLIVPYTLCSAIGSKTLAYGDPFNYMLALFGDYSIRVDDSVKAVERMSTILGDITLSGNLTVDKGFSVAALE